MLNLHQYRSKKPCLPDLLNWASVIDDGVVLNKDGSLMAAWAFRGHDLATATAAERDQGAGVVNAALNRLGSEWMVHVDAVRVEAAHYPAEGDSHFPDAVTRMIDQSRRTLFESGAHYETRYVLVATFLPAKVAQNRAAALMFEGGDTAKGKGAAADRVLAQFRAAVMELEDRLSSVLSLTRLRGIEVTDVHGETHVHDGLLQWLHYALSGDPHPVLLPAVPMYLDAVIGGYDFWTGVVPRVGNKLLRVVAIDGFPQESYQGILAALDQLPIPYRWSTRFVFQDPVDAKVGLSAFRRKWQQQIRGFADQVMRTSKGAVNQDAVEMVAEADSALSEASSGLVTYGYYTSVVVLMGADPVLLDEHAREVKRLINNLGFVARVESVNAVEAWLGSLPGHALPNLRRPMMHTLQLAHLLPLSSVWAGRENAPCPFYPPHSPPLLHAVTDGSTPFRLNLHVGDVGHTLILGPTGTGKSTLLGLLAAQARRYAGASVFVFDKGRSMEALTRAVGGQHYDIAGEDVSLCFAPLANLDRPGETGWAEEWVATLMTLQGVVLTPQQRKELGRALKLLAQAEPTGRTLTALQVTLQDMAMKDALHPYTISGSMGQLLDAESDTLSLSSWGCFEIEHLMNRDDKVRLPVLLYLFHVLEDQMKGQPGFLFLDEAWLMLGHEVFRAKIREWLKVLRKANWSVVLATQSISDAANSGILDVLSESCPTKIFLANRDAPSDENVPLYQLLGCNAAEIRVIAAMIPKRQYLVKGEGSRKIELGLSPLELAFVGVSSKPDLEKIRELSYNYGVEWVDFWLKDRGVL